MQQALTPELDREPFNGIVSVSQDQSNKVSPATPFIPGFATVQEALAAGQSFFAKANGAKGRYQRDFHIVSNEHGRFHFEAGPKPLPSPALTTEGA